MAQPQTVYFLNLLKADGQTVHASWSLNVESVKQSLTRHPVLFALPVEIQDKNDPFNNFPRAWGLDLGLLDESFTISGQIDDNQAQPAFGNPQFITITRLQQLARIAGTGVSSDSGKLDPQSFAPAGAIMLQAGTGPNQGAGSNNDTWNLKGYVLSLQSNRDGGGTWWDYSLQIGLVDWKHILG